MILLFSSVCSGNGGDINLPRPVSGRSILWDNVKESRRSVRSFSEEPVSLKELSSLLYAATGITDTTKGFRTCPSAGATFPLEVFVFVKRVDDLKRGVYRYSPQNHSLKAVLLFSEESDKEYNTFLIGFNDACNGQKCVIASALSIVITADFQRTTARYGDRGIMYVHQETGHVGQNISLEVVSLGLGTVAVGAFYEDFIMDLLNTEFRPLYIFPVGRPNAQK